MPVPDKPVPLSSPKDTLVRRTLREIQIQPRRCLTKRRRLRRYEHVTHVVRMRLQREGEKAEAVETVTRDVGIGRADRDRLWHANLPLAQDSIPITNPDVEAAYHGPGRQR